MSGFPRCEFVVEAHFRGKRIDTFLEKHLRNYTPYQIHRLLRAGCVIANDTPIDTLYRVKTRDQVRVHLICPPDRTTVAESLSLDVIYEDAWLLIVNKPPGMMAHPGGDYQKSTLLNAMLGEQVDYVCDPILGPLPHMRAGTLKALAAASDADDERSRHNPLPVKRKNAPF